MGNNVIRKIKYSEKHPASIFVTCPTSIALNMRQFHQKSPHARNIEKLFSNRTLAACLLKNSVLKKRTFGPLSVAKACFLHATKIDPRGPVLERGRNQKSATLYS